MSDAVTTAPRPAARLLPPSSGGELPLLLVIAVIMALAAASGVAVRAAWTSAAAWSGDLAAGLTVQVSPGVDASAEAAAARAAATLEALPGVAQARALSSAEIAALLEPWFGTNGPPDAVPAPGLVDVTLDPLTPAKPQAVSIALAAAGFEAVVDDHSQFRQAVNRAATALRTLTGGALACLLLAAVLVTSFATRAGLAARADVVEALHLVGARDGYIAGLFARRFLALGLRAGLLGAALAFAATLGYQALAAGGQAAGGNFIPAFRFTGADVIIIAATPLLAAFIAAGTARATVLRSVKDLY